jgi:hypothetical protein
MTIALIPALAAALGAGVPAQSPATEALRKSLIFHAPFDGSADAEFARGDKRIFTAASGGAAARKDAKPGLHRGDVVILPGKGRFGDALKFGKKDKATVFFSGERNMAYSKENWAGTVCLWLSLDPDKDLEPGFSDPIQITDKTWNDAAFFVDFTKDDKPRHFRLGAYADFKVWNPANTKFGDIPHEKLPLSPHVTRPPFARDRWTHVVFTFERFNTGKPDAVAELYLDGKSVGAIRNRVQTFTWDEGRAAIMLGLSYIGLMDDLAIFDRALTAEEAAALYGLEQGIRSLRR